MRAPLELPFSTHAVAYFMMIPTDYRVTPRRFFPSIRPPSSRLAFAAAADP